MSPVIAVCSGIGRGHPAYLDSVLAELRKAHHDVPTLCPEGPGWLLARFAYRLGAQGGLLSALYNRLRAGSRPSRLQLAMLDSGLRRRFAGCRDIVLADHPLLAHLLAPVCRVAYLHAEIAAPAFCAVHKAWRTFVPLDSTAARLEGLGVKRERLCVTGLVIEPALVQTAESAFAARLARLDQRESGSAAPLTVAFFTSGAYPRAHLQQIAAAARSVASSGHQPLIFSGWSRTHADRLRRLITASVICSDSRQSETARSCADFARFDVMVAAAHERINWALGLGLPMFALLPHIGPFARENFAFAAAQGVCLLLDEPATFGSRLTDLLRSGRLHAMARAGWGRHAVSGAAAVAASLLDSQA